MVGRANTRRARAIAWALLLLSLLRPLSLKGAEAELDHLAQVLQLRPGLIVADVGAGSGEISLAIARYVMPKGKVYSTEIDPRLVEKIRRAAEQVEAGTIVAVTASADDTGLPPNCCDAIFLREVYHHLIDPMAIDRSLYRAIRPGGRLAIIDFDPSQRPGEPPPPGVPASRGGHGVPARIVTEELGGVGFRLVNTMDWPISATIKHYCLTFRKPPD